MVERRTDVLSRTYSALADASRRAILQRLARGPKRVTDVARPFAMSLNGVSKHIRALEQAGLVRRHVQGREHYLSIDPSPLAAAVEWLEGYRVFWESRLDALEKHLRKRRSGLPSRRRKR